MSDIRNKNLILFITTLAAFLTPFMASAINISLPAIGIEFGMNAVLLSWVVTAYMLAAAMALVPFGRIADIYGRKKVFLIGIIVFTIASLWAALSNSTFILIFSRVLQGIGGAMTFGTGTAILISAYPFNERGKILGINIGAVYLGLSLGPFLGGILTQYFGWRSIFLVNVPLGLIVLILTLWKLKSEWVECKDEKLDFAGSIVYGLTLLFIMYGLSILPKLFGFVFIVFGIAGILLLINRESRVVHPILNINLFRKNITFAFSNLAAAINYSATSAVGFLLSLYLQNIKDLNPKDAGLVLVSQPIVMAVFSPLAGRLSDKIEPRITASIGMALTFIGLLLFVPINANTSMGFIIFNLLLLGLGFALFSSPNTNAVMSSIDKKFYGVASGTLATMRMIGQMFSMGIAMLIFSVIMGRVKISSEYYGVFLKSIGVAFSIFAVLCFGGIFASLARGKLRNTQ
jgi:EmrB/QacA subfamily drug resistance transporter